MSDLLANKQTAFDFYQLMFNDNQPREARTSTGCYRDRTVGAQRSERQER